MQQARFEYWQSVRNIPAHELVCIDESGVDLGLTRLRARSVKGRRAYGKRPSRQGRRVSMLSAISLKAVLTNCNGMGTTDSLTFEAFIAQRLVPQLWAGACVILDNCSIHKGANIRRLIEEAGARLLFLPPYSPDFSPIENCFSKVKSILRFLKARTYPDLVTAIAEAFSQVSSQDLTHWFTHACYYAPPA